MYDNAEPERLPVTAAVLAGGRSLRMGVDKTLLEVEGKALVSRVIDAVSSVCRHVIVATNRPDSIEHLDLPLDVRIVVDEVPYQGPLGGLATALAASEDDWVLAVAADMPWVEPDIVRALWDARDGALVVVPVTPDGPEPLLALYHRDCLPFVREALESGRRRLVAFFRDVTVAEVTTEALRAADPALRSLINVNTPEDLSEATAAAGSAIPESVAPAKARIVSRPMPSERPITIHMNDSEIATVQASPEDLEELAVGFLLSEGLIADRSAMHGVDVDKKRGLAYVRTDEPVPEDLVYRSRYLTSGCGKGVTFASVGHAKGLARVDSELRMDAGEILALMRRMTQAAARHRDTGGMHSCALAREGELAYVREDVGRHNAMDKLLGRAWLDGIGTEDVVLLSTGRISYEMAVKAAKARVPVVVSLSAVTDLAAEVAAEVGVTLVGYARGDSLTVYTHPERVVSEVTAS